MNESNNLLYLSEKTLERLGVTTAEATDSIESLILRCDESRAWSAPKACVMPPDGRLLMATLAAADDPPFLAVKSLVLNPRNSARGLKQINALIVLHDSDTGLPVAIIDGNWITAIRTAGASAVAAKRLARPDSSVAAFIGCGVQANSHLRAFSELFPLSEIRAFGRGSTNRDALCQRAEKMGLVAIASNTAKEAVQDADIIITSVTFSTQLEPFLDARWLKPGAFLTSTDLAQPWMPESMFAFDRIIIDDLAQEAIMVNKLVKPNLISGDLTGLITEKVSGRRTNEERTAFIFRAVAVGDLALAAVAYQKARSSSQELLVDMT